MANAWEHPSVIAAEALMHLEDALVISNLAARDKTGEFTSPGMKVGDSVKIRTRPDYEAKEFTNDGTNTITKQAIRESTRPFTIEKMLDISVDVTAREKTLDLDSFSEQVIMPAAYRLAEYCDQYVGTKILTASGQYNSSSLFGAASDVALARKAATLQQLDSMGRFCLVDLDLEAVVLGQTWFNQSQTRGGPGVSTLQSGVMGQVMGMDFVSSINFPVSAVTHGNGSSQTDNGAGGNTNNQIGASVLTFDSLTGQIEAGDRLTIAGVRRPVIAAAQAVATSTSVALVDPISEIIPDNAAITTVASGLSVDAHGAIFDSSSLGVAMPPLDAPSDKPSSVASSNGYSIRVVQGYDMDKKVETLSLDLLIGAVLWDPRRVTLLTEN